ERAASLRAEQRLAAGGRRLPRPELVARGRVLRVVAERSRILCEKFTPSAKVGWFLDGMEAAAERPEEQQARAASLRRQDAPSGPEINNATQDMGSLLEEYEESQHTQLRRGELVEGTVVLVDR